MRRTLTYALTAVFIIALLSFMVTYTVKFTDAAIVTTFGKADKETAVRKEPGLYFKLPYPIQSVTIYDKRMRPLQGKFEQIATKDHKQVAVEMFCLWRVDEPLTFFQRFSNAGSRAEDHYRKAESALGQNLRAASALVSQYSMDELFPKGGQDPNRNSSRLPELQSKMLDVFRGTADQSGLKLSDYGIAAEDLGISRVVLTEEVSKSVMERMKAGREKYTKTIQAAGQSEASAIRSQADSDAERIRSFADRLAQETRSQGDREAVQYISKMKEHEELAVFQSNMDFIRDVLSKRTQLVLSGSMPGIWLMFPDALQKVGKGQVPPVAQPAPAAPKKTAEVQDDGQPISSIEGGTK